MTTNEIVRSWKDEDYRLNLKSEELSLVPDNPAGLVELTDQELFDIEGGITPTIIVASFLLSASTMVISVEITEHVCSWGRCR
jgi:mersacidin/lichenicidin family type 2 lantibiotic